MATHSSVLAWRIPGKMEPDGLPSRVAQSQTRLKRLSSSSDYITSSWRLARGVLFLSPSDAYVRSFLRLLCSLIKLYYTKALKKKISILVALNFAKCVAGAQNSSCFLELSFLQCANCVMVGSSQVAFTTTLLFNYSHILGISQVWFQTTAIKWIQQ